MDFATQIAARTLWAEARGEPEVGQRAVAHVFVNRLKSGRWGNSLATVCLAPSQFSCWLPRDPNLKALAALNEDDPLLLKLRSYVEDAMAGHSSDITKLATHYFSTSMVMAPEWSKTGTFTGQFGNHKFYKDVA